MTTVSALGAKQLLRPCQEAIDTAHADAPMAAHGASTGPSYCIALTQHETISPISWDWQPLSFHDLETPGGAPVPASNKETRL